MHVLQTQVRSSSQVKTERYGIFAETKGFTSNQYIGEQYSYLGYQERDISQKNKISHLKRTVIDFQVQRTKAADKEPG